MAVCLKLCELELELLDLLTIGEVFVVAAVLVVLLDHPSCHSIEAWGSVDIKVDCEVDFNATVGVGGSDRETTFFSCEGEQD